MKARPGTDSSPIIACGRLKLSLDAPRSAIVLDHTKIPGEKPDHGFDVGRNNPWICTWKPLKPEVLDGEVQFIVVLKSQPHFESQSILRRKGNADLDRCVIVLDHSQGRKGPLNLGDCFPCDGFAVAHGLAMPNDPRSATRPTGRADCNRDGAPPFAVAHG